MDYLIRGNPIRLTELVSHLNTSKYGYTAVLDHTESNRKYFSQVIHPPEKRSAYFTFLTPDHFTNPHSMLALVDYLSYQAGELGAQNVLAEVEESHPLFETFRRAGFSVFSWESVWRLPQNSPDEESATKWHIPTVTDGNTVRSFYQTLVPPLVQNAEPFVNGAAQRLLYKTDGETQAYVEIVKGHSGTYLIPLIHPSVEDVHALIRDLISHFNGTKKPVYMQVRSYQAWLSEALGDLRAEPSPRFALMVKHLAVAQWKAVRETGISLSEKSPATPLVTNCADQGLTSDGLK